MNGNIVNTYLNALDAKVAAQDRQILMLVDNAPPHILHTEIVLRNIRVRMLPKKTTAYLQPQDAGIIASFKSKVKQRQLENALDQIDALMAGRQGRYVLYEVPLVVAMGWAKEAWRSVSQSTVTNCWVRTGILDGDLSVLSERMSELVVGNQDGCTIRDKIPVGCFILGDAGYALFPWLITPFLPHEEGGKLSSMQKHFNFKHSSTRITVECAFGRLKERFRILKTPMKEKTLDRTVCVVAACFVLHNMFLQFNDGLFDIPCPRRD
ncbi:hypothetical protein H257_08317 [Aphanomyces astaci]|uniref:DDE Tnp4 domain-containing protein n=1 Tax=Aphanomyces astaci TaxID=112090 RepID=W4GEK2_APHAT|nr:hypothetical protein H257_08317 [Aphanomyces astaci]ETV78112.1 hypothetical protein H257_08317 [Aphanomyces astaci]|eukprot:XP_009832449.1 hypothetical protein H257_08317 [Aphanomyces astaci]